MENLFDRWVIYGILVAVVGIAIVWVNITKFLIPPRMDSLAGGTGAIRDEFTTLGSMTPKEKRCWWDRRWPL